MDTQGYKLQKREPVRWPFRLLAAIIVLAAAVALVGTGAMWWSHDVTAPRWQALFALPGVAWLARLAWESAIRGRSPASEYWPFASQGVFAFYLLAMLAASCV